MSTNDNPANVKPGGNAKMRYLFLLLLGLAIGIVGTVMVTNAWQQAHQQDPYPGSVMHVMDAHLDALGNSVKQNRCAASDTQPHLQTLRLVANDIEVAFSGQALDGQYDDPRFSDHASDLRATLDNALSNLPLNCADVGTTVKKIGGQCKACHKQFKPS